MSFELSPGLDKNRFFLINRSELKGRLDTVFYHPKYLANELAIKTSKWGHERVGSIAHRIADGPFGSDLKVEEYKTEGNPLLRVSNIKTGEIEGDLVYISDQKQRQLKRSKVYPNDVLLTKAGAILGYSAVFPKSLKEGNITSHLVTITCKEDINPHFLSHFFRSEIGQLQIYRWGNKSTRPELNTEEVKSILVTMPPSHVQARIVECLNVAYVAKKKTENQARALLASIDDLLLSELGIPNSPEPPNTLESRKFQRQFSEVSGDRFDPHYHHPRFAHLIDRLEAVPHFALRDLVDFSHEQWDQKSIFEDTFPYIEIGAVNLEFGRLTEAAITPVSEAANRAKMLVRPGDLLISLTRPTRKAICFSPEELDLAVASNGFCVVRGRKREELSIRYLFHVLRSCLCNEQFNQRSSGGNYPAITEEQLSRVLIPWAEPKTQESIVRILDEKYAEAEDLYSQAQADLEQAKRDIEAMILGEPMDAA